MDIWNNLLKLCKSHLAKRIDKLCANSWCTSEEFLSVISDRIECRKRVKVSCLRATHDDMMLYRDRKHARTHERRLDKGCTDFFASLVLPLQEGITSWISRSHEGKHIFGPEWCINLIAESLWKSSEPHKAIHLSGRFSTISSIVIFLQGRGNLKN